MPLRRPGCARLARPLPLAAATLLALTSPACGSEPGQPDGQRREQRAETAQTQPRPAAAHRARRRGRPRSWNGFRAGRWPGADWRPYAASSPFNSPLPRRVRTHPRSRRYVEQMLARGEPAPIVGGVGGTRDDYAHPTFWARRSDPLYVLRPSTSWGEPRLRGRRIRVPRRARPAPGSDGHLTVVQPNGWEYDFWRAQRPDRRARVLRYAAGARLRVDGSGIDGGATAADFGNLAGVIRAPELAAGRIDHALFLVVRCASGNTSFGFGARRPRVGSASAYVHPAGGGGARCPRGVEAPPLGARVQLAMSEAELDALEAPPWKRAVLGALARYGAYIGDTGGPGFAVMLESSLTYTAFGRPDPFRALGRDRLRRGDIHVSAYQDRVLFDLASGVDWSARLRVVVPPRR